LLLEDDASFARLIQVYLQDDNDGEFHVSAHRRLAEALAEVAERRFDVILLDLSVPDSRGLETLVRMKAQAPNTPIVVLSGFDDDQVAADALKQGAEDYLMKGRLDRQQVTRVARFAVARSRLARALDDSNAEVKRLRALLPVCPSCHGAREGDDYQNALRDYLSSQSDATASGTPCPECGR